MPGKNVDLHGSAPTGKIIGPEQNDYFVLKAKHSGFFSTTLETLLRYLEAETLILAGNAGNFCVLFTANDAYMRDSNLFCALRFHRIKHEDGKWVSAQAHEEIFES